MTIVGDPHLKPDNLDKAQKLFSMVEDLGYPTVWLGDMLDSKEIIRGKCLNALYNYFKDSNLNHTLLIGNHCWFNLECQDHSLRLLSELPNITIIDSPTILSIDYRTVAFMPFYSNLDEFRKDLNNLNYADILFLHQGISGFDYGNGYIAHDEIEITELKNFSTVISGHFHAFQQVDNLTYLGSPFSHSFGESNQEKVIGVLNLKTRKITTIPTPFPRHITIETTVNDIDLDVNDNNYYRVMLKGTQQEIEAFDKSKYPKVKFIENPIDTDFNSNIIVAETDSNEVKFIKWAKEVKHLDAETIKLGVELLREAH